jgi:integrase
MGIHLREKKLGNGQVSLYLDIYHNKKRWYEFLDIHINSGRLSTEDKEKKQLAQQIKVKRENELIVEDNGLINRQGQKADFPRWLEKYATEKSPKSHYPLVLRYIREYLGHRSLTFQAIGPEWIMGFTKFLLTKVSNNTARDYIKAMRTALGDAERAGIIRKNPFSLMERKDMLRPQDTFRKAYTFEELGRLIQTPCNIPQQMKQAYLFSCFCGLRWSDTNCLRWEQISVKQIANEENYFIHFQQEKTDAIEYQPLSAQAVEILKQRKRDRIEEPLSVYVFPKIKEPKNNRSMNRMINNCLKKWAEAAGLNPKHMHFHTARHTFATNVLEHSADGDLWTVSKLLGHKSILTTMIYAKVRDKRKSAAVKSLPKLELQAI